MADEPVVDPAAPVVDPLAPVDPYAGVSAADLIPEELAGRDPAEVRLLLSQMPRIIKAQKDDIANLRIQMAGGSAPTVTHGPPVPAAPAQTAEEAKAAFEELFDKDPRAAIAQFVEGEYGGRFGSLEDRLGTTDLSMMRGQIDDFHEYEEDVTKLLTQSGSPATQQNIQGAYAMAVGQRAIEKKAQMARAEANPLPNTPAPDPAASTIELTSVQDEVRQTMGLSVEDYSKYISDDSFDLKIRT